MSPKIIYYYQTFIGLEKILNQSPKVVTDIMISSIHFGSNLDVLDVIPSTDLMLRSIKKTLEKPLLFASIPTAPEPANRSRNERFSK